jgi:hypothetical protein
LLKQKVGNGEKDEKKGNNLALEQNKPNLHIKDINKALKEI